MSLDKLAVTPPHKVPYGTAANGTLFDTPPRFKINDRVVVYNKKNVAIHGTVRWTGRDVQTRTLNTNHIGIETVSAVFSVPYINITISHRTLLLSLISSLKH